MPSIPIYDADSSVRTPGLSPTTPRPTIPVDAIRGAAQAVTNRYNRDQAIAQQQQEQKTREVKRDEALVSLAKAHSDATLEFTQQLQAGRDTPPDQIPGFAATIGKNWDQWVSDREGTIPPEAQAVYQQQMYQLRGHFLSQAADVETNVRQVKVAADQKSSIDAASQAVGANDGLYGDALARQLATIGALQVPADVRTHLEDYARTTIGYSAAQGVRMRNPAATVEALNRYFGLPPSVAQSGEPAAAGSDPAAYAPSANDPRGIRANNPGNVKAAGSAWQGMVGVDSGYAQFATPEAGLRALSKNLQAYGSKGVDTVQSIVARWAPASDGNDVPGYVAAVSAATGFAPDQKLDLRDRDTLLKLSSAIVTHENGRQPYSQAQLAAGVDASLGTVDLPLPGTPRTITAAEGMHAINEAGGRPGDAGLPYFSNLSAPQALQLRNEAVADLQRQQSTARAALEDRTKDFQAMVLDGKAPPAGSIPSALDYATAFGPDGERRYRTEVAEYQHLSEGLRSMDGASWSDRQAVLERFAPTPGPGYEEHQRMHQQLLRANMLFEKRLATDPAAAAMAAPAVRAAALARDQVMGDQASTPAARQAAVDAYAMATTAEQQRLGVDRIGADALGEAGKTRQPGVRLLTNGEANAIAARFHENSADAAQLMEGLQATYGKRFPDVYAQLAADDKLPPAALVIPNMSDPFAKETLSRLSDPKLQKELMDNLPAGASKDIEAKLQQANEPFYLTLGNQQGGQRLYGTVLNAQRTLAASYVAQGRSVSDATSIAFEQTVGHKYQFADTLRIPNEEQPGSVLQGTVAIARHPELAASAAPPSFRPNLAAKDRDAAWLDSLNSGATWVANGDESGATLYVRARTDAGGDAYFAARDAGGRPLTWTWSQLRAIGSTYQAQRERTLATSPAASFGNGTPMPVSDGVRLAHTIDTLHRSRAWGTE